MKRTRPAQRITLDDLPPENRRKAEAIIARLPETIAQIESEEPELLAWADQAFAEIEAHRARLRAAIDQLKAQRKDRD